MYESLSNTMRPSESTTSSNSWSRKKESNENERIFWKRFSCSFQDKLDSQLAIDTVNKSTLGFETDPSLPLFQISTCETNISCVWRALRIPNLQFLYRGTAPQEVWTTIYQRRTRYSAVNDCNRQEIGVVSPRTVRNPYRSLLFRSRLRTLEV